MLIVEIKSYPVENVLSAGDFLLFYRFRSEVLLQFSSVVGETF